MGIRKRLSAYLAEGAQPDKRGYPPLFAIRNRLPPRIAAHRHDFFEIELILSGHGCNSMGALRQKIGPGSILLGNQFEGHAIEWDSPITILSIKFGPDLLTGAGHLLDPLVVPDPVFRCRLPDLPPQAACRFKVEAENLLAEFSQGGPFWVEAAIASLTSLLVIICRAWEEQRLATNTPLLSRPNHLILEILAFIDGHFHETHGLDGLEARLGYSRPHLNRVFRAVAGQSLQDFVIAKRLGDLCDMPKASLDLDAANFQIPLDSTAKEMARHVTR